MWLYYFLIVIILLKDYDCSEFTLDRDECLLTSKNHSLIIDLYSAHSFEEVDNYTIHFSLCPKRLKICPKNSFICMVDSNGMALDLGSEISGITYEGAFNVALKSSHGSGNVYIMCSQSDMNPLFDTFPQLEGSQSTSYSIKWMSSSSCPLTHYKTKNSCILYTKDQSYDLRPLQYYLSDLYAEYGSQKYYISFCKDISHKKCSDSSVCVFHNGTFHSIASFEDSIFQYIEKRGLSLTYKNLNGGNTVIHFICTLNSSVPKVQFVEIDDRNLVFNVSTSLVCSQNKMNCLIDQKVNSIGSETDRHIVYDLTSLHLLKDSWHLDLRDGKRILFNLCGPVNLVPYVFCSGGPYFACVLDNSNRTVALAYDVKENILQPGLISLEISGKTMDSSNFSLHITLECVKHSTYPSLLENGALNNTYVVNWKTNAACPSEINKGEGSDCKLKNPYYQTLVDVSPLHKKTGDYSVVVGAESFRINVCGRLNRSCSETKDASICYKNKDGKEISIGLIGSQEPIFKDGQFLFHIEGEPCNEKVTKSKIKIILLCEYFEGANSTVQADPQFFERANECEFYFIWRTSTICPNHESINCTFQSQNKIYDLSPLKKINENYVIHYNESTEIVLNICHPVLPGHRIRCHPLSGSCLVYDDMNYIKSEDYIKKQKFESLGLVSNFGNFEFVNGSIHLTYRNGGICEFGTESSLKTVVVFECDETAVDTQPVLTSSDECEFHLKWRTYAACPINSDMYTTLTPINKNKTVDNKKCTVNSEKKKYDLSSLSGMHWHVENRNIILSVCSPMTACSINLNNVGACLMTEDGGFENIGDFNTNLLYEEGSVYLHYNTSNHRQTKIQFVCSKDDLKPKFIKEKELNNDVITFISWPTPLVCDEEAEKRCCNQIENLCQEYDGTYMVSLNEMHSVILSLCRPVIPKEGYLCDGSTSSCFLSKSNNTFSETMSLGKVFQEPILNKEKSIIVEYFNGSMCKNNVNYSTSIRFYCAYNVNDFVPKFVRTIGDCKYEFDWGTNLLCTHFMNESSRHYQAIDSNNEIIINGSSVEYIVGLCVPSPKCRSHICKYSDNKWEALSGRMIKNETAASGLKYHFTSAKNSDNEKCGVLVKFVHNTTSENGFTLPAIRKEGDCILEIILKGNKTCPPVTKIDGTEKVSGSHTATIAWSVISFILIVVILLFIIWLKKRNTLVESFPFIFRYKVLNSSSSLIDHSFDEESTYQLKLFEKEISDKLK